MKPIAAAVFSESRRDFFWLGAGGSVWTSSPTLGLGFNLNFGGFFTSVPVAVAAIAPHEMILDPGDDVLIASRAQAEPEEQAYLERTARATVPGLVIGGGTGGTRPLTPRLDLFGLGGDYAMYTKRFWGAQSEHHLDHWTGLGGTFTSTPAAVGWAGTRVDVFGVGLDHAMYTKTCLEDQWTPAWQYLGGEFTSAAATVARGNQLDIFARGADFTLRGNHTDGSEWFGWQNHGGELASSPAVVSWGPERVDIFAVFRDGRLWHRWWDGEIWNEWESLGGNYVGEPAVASWSPGRLDVFAVGAEDGALYHQWFTNQTWSDPERLSIGSTEKLAASPTVISTAENRLEVFVPTRDHQIRIVKWDGQSWGFQAAGTGLRTPQRYRISVDMVNAITARSLNKDTDAAMASVTAGNNLPRIKTQWIGEIGGTGFSTSQTNLLEFDSVIVELAEPMSFSYLVVNNGHASQNEILNALANAGDSLSLSSSTSMQEDIANRVVSFLRVKLMDATAISVPVAGPILGYAESWLLDQLIAAAFESCDGLVAAENRALMGRDLYRLTGNGAEPLRVTTFHEGTHSPTACGANSEYEVTWTIRPI